MNSCLYRPRVMPIGARARTTLLLWGPLSLRVGPTVCVRDA